MQPQKKQNKMFIKNENNNGLNGLNGRWKEFWNGFKSSVGLKDNSDTQGSAGGFWKRLGAKLGRKIVSIASGGILKIAQEYQPTQSELLILNPIKENLNNWAFELMEMVDIQFENATTNEQKTTILNNAVRQINIVADFYNIRSNNNLSTEAYDWLFDSIFELVEIFELTIEDILDSSLINYTKSEVALSQKTDDYYPEEAIYTTSFNSSGHQYFLAANQNPINVEVPPVNPGYTAPPINTGGAIKTVISIEPINGDLEPPKPPGQVINNPAAATETNIKTNNNLGIVLGLFSVAVLFSIFSSKKAKKQ